MIPNEPEALYFMHIHDADSVQDSEYHHAYVSKYRKPHIHDAEYAKDEAQAFYAQCHYDVFPDYAKALA